MTTFLDKKVSVIVPNYNYGRYIKRRIRSILRQTYPIHELIILDDHSTDGSVELIKNLVLDLKLEKPKLSIRFVPSEKNSGKAMSQWKKGWEMATGDYIWIAEADDLCKRDFLAEAMKGFDDPKVVLSYTESEIINSWGMIIAPNFQWSRDKEKTGHYDRSYIKDGKNEIEDILAIRCTIPNVSGVIFKKEKIFKKYLDEALKFTQAGDWYFYVKVLEHGKIRYSHRALNKFRIHANSKTAEAKKDKLHYHEVLKMHKMIDENYRLTKLIKERMLAEEVRIKARMAG